MKTKFEIDTETQLFLQGILVQIFFKKYERSSNFSYHVIIKGHL